MTTEQPHSHCWIDPLEPPIQRAPYSPVIGTGRREMKVGHRYVCRECTAIIVVPMAGDRASGRGGATR